MASAELLSEEAFGFEDGMEAFSNEFEGFEGFEGFEAEGEDSDLFGEEAESLEDDPFLEGFEMDEASGLYTPSSGPRIISGPAAMLLARGLDPFVRDAMDADDADAFFRRMRNRIRGAIRTAGRIGRIAAPILSRAAPLLRRAMPLIQRALPIVQRVASVAGPWGRVISAGIGAAQGLMQGRGLRGALAGAVGGLIPGVGGQIASSILKGDGADDDAALDALADMTAAKQVPPAVALPIAAGLGARVVSQQVVPAGTNIAPAAQQTLQARTQALEQYLLRTAMKMPGDAGQRLRLLGVIARVAAKSLRQRAPNTRLAAMPKVTQGVSKRVLAQAQSTPGLGAVSPKVAAQRVEARKRILRQVPIAVLGTAIVRQAHA